MFAAADWHGYCRLPSSDGKKNGTFSSPAPPPSVVPVGTLLFVLLLGLGAFGLLLIPAARTRAAGRRLTKVGFLGALGLVGLFVLISVLTLPFD